MILPSKLKHSLAILTTDTLPPASLNAFMAHQTFKVQTAAFTSETFTADLSTFALQFGLTSKH